MKLLLTTALPTATMARSGSQAEYSSVRAPGFTGLSIFTDTSIITSTTGRVTKDHFRSAVLVPRSTVQSFTEMRCTTYMVTKLRVDTN